MIVANPIYCHYEEQYYHQSEEKPLLLLNFDINGTLILADKSKGVDDEYMIIKSLTDNTIAKWDAHTEPMSFSDYNKKVLVPEEPNDLARKKERYKNTGSFLEWLSSHSHPAFNDVLEKYNKIKSKLEESKNQNDQLKIFKSFYVMVEKLQQMNIPFKIILRSFGKEIPEVVKELQEHSPCLKNFTFAKFDGTKLNVNGQGTIEKVDDIFDAFLTSADHFAVQDDWTTWHEDNELGRSGKPFIYDLSGNKRIKTLSLFFDDNITGENEDIVKPCGINDKNTTKMDLMNRCIFPVQTADAMLDDNYYINKVRQALILNHLECRTR